MKKKDKKSKVLYDHFLECSKSKCGFKFSIEHENQDNKEIGLEDFKCPKCQNPMMLDKNMLDVGGQPSKKAQAHANVQATTMAHQLAAEQKMRDAREGNTNEMVTVKNPKTGETAIVPKKVVDSIEELIAPALK